MGCTASKLDHEDTVRRCKDRRRLIKDAVFSRHHLASAHSDYFRSLRLTGSALSDFASDEPLSVSDSTPSVLLPNPLPPSSFQINSTPPPIRTRYAAAVPASPAPPPPYSPTIASSNLPHILSGSSLKSGRRRSEPKLPHILSDSTPSSTPTTVNSAAKFGYPSATYVAHATCPTSPPQASSVWNWENFRPPSPPPSDFFNPHRRKDDNNNNHHLEMEEESESEGEGRETEPEEVHCSDWGDRYTTTTSESEDDDIDGDGDDERETRSEVSDFRSRSNFGSSAPIKAAEMSSHNGAPSEVSDMRMVVRHRDLKEIVASIKEYFDKAASSGEQVAEMLETGRAQLDRGFKQLKKTVYHSNGILSSLSSSWTSKPPLAFRYTLDEPGGGSKSLCSTLECLFAWENKLYQEVKAREGVKIEHEKKLKTLQSREYKGEDGLKLDKTKTSIKKLQSLIVVTSQAVNTTSSAIVGLRDSDLVPQLVELCHGLMYMWRSMNQSHEFQNQIVQQVRGLVNQVVKGDSTSELHRQATRDLESAVSAWHSSFCRLVKYQRVFICSVHGWFKLTLLPIDSDVPILTRQPTEAYTFFDDWKLALDHLPDTVASENIKSFVHVVHVISTQHNDEMKMKKKTEIVSKELEKKASSLRSIEKKYYHSYSMVGLGLPDNGQVLDARDPLAEKKAELAVCQRRLEDEMLKYAKAVEVTRAMTLNNIQTGLPGVFQAMTSFSSLFVEALEKVCTRSYAIK